MAAVAPIDLTEVLKNAPAGDWIALSRDEKEIVGTGKTVEEAIRVAREAGEENPIVMKIPPVSALIL
ncbi:MAG: DUF5678 domain-containing protein [Terriglobales bacterium]